MTRPSIHEIEQELKEMMIEHIIADDGVDREKAERVYARREGMRERSDPDYEDRLHDQVACQMLGVIRGLSTDEATAVSMVTRAFRLADEFILHRRERRRP